MWGFEKCVMAGRATNSLMSMEVVGHLMGQGSAGEKAAALRFVDSMGSSFQRAIKTAVGNGDTGEATRVMSNYLIGKTMFNFDRASMSEYGRFMGPLFSAFTKWPTSIAGDMLHIYSRNGLAGGTAEVGRKYMAPLALLYAANAAIKDDTKDNPMYDWAFGKQGLTHLAPAGAAAGLLTGQMAAPPSVAIPRDVIMGIGTADPYKLYRALNDAFNAFTPVVPSIARTLVHLNSLSEGKAASRGTLLNQVDDMMGGELQPDRTVRDFATAVGLKGGFTK
jgi:hypothetical protein